eukprot:TRINITY_DN2127_c0_g2_i2.p1 TRINITY_DN2127_c0_g2~~TRINITY_DN2127_c0_g2_i2.p1  ORF type:complete len:713 (+),score=202.70 TRINITY_DN2127_c0_g2_i2:325-2463(+)
MDLGDGSVGSRCEKEEVTGKDVRLNEIECGINGPNDVSGIGDLGSGVECIKFETLDKSADVGESPVINGSCGDANRKIVQSVETNGEIVGIEEVVATTSMVVASPPDIIEGLEYAGSQLKSKEVDKVENLGKMVESDEIRLDSDVSVVYETGDFDRTLGLNGKGIKTGKTLESPSSANGSPKGDSEVSPNKGFGLRKWRRKRRDGTKDGAGMVDPNRILKRGFSNPEPVRTRGLSVENRHKSEGSGSDAYANSIVKDRVFSALSVGVCDSESRACDSEYRAAVGTAFSIGTDSENSEDRSSKSTAASAPKLRQEVPPVGGFVKEKNKVKNTKNPGNAVHKAQQGKGKVEASKKLRGDRIKVEKENSHSSVESDLRSSNAVFPEADAFARATYGRQGEGSSNYDGENSDRVQLCELQSSEEVRADYYKENGEEAEVVSRVDVVGCLSKVENKESENQGPDPDPLAESVTLLQAAQEALEKEIENFREIGKEPVSPPDSSSCGASSSAQLPPEEMEDITSAPKEASAAELIQKVSLLEHELQGATTILKAKESKVLELESILNSTQLPKQKAKDIPTSLEEICREMEIELEVMLKDKIEAEVEYLLMVRHTQKLKIMAEEQVSLVEQLKTLAENQEKMLMKLGDAEDKATKLEKQAEELVASSRELLGAEDVLKMQNDVCKFSLCSFAQLLLFCMAFALFLLQLLPHSHEVVPT